MDKYKVPRLTPGKRTGLTTGLVIFGVIALFLFLYAISDHSSKITAPATTNTASTQAAEPSPAAVRQATIAKYAPLYCKNHQHLHMSTSFFSDNQDWPVFNGTRAWTSAECKAIIGKLYDTSSNDEHLATVANAKWGIGMTLHELIYAVGVPTAWHTTNLADGTQQQLIYGDPLYNATYIYLDNGTVTSSQN